MCVCNIRVCIFVSVYDVRCVCACVCVRCKVCVLVAMIRYFCGAAGLGKIIRAAFEREKRLPVEVLLPFGSSLKKIQILQRLHSGSSLHVFKPSSGQSPVVEWLTAFSLSTHELRTHR